MGLKKYHPKGYWIAENIAKEALKYNHRIDFKKANSPAYKAACALKILDTVCSHMKVLGNREKRLIYTATNGRNIYIGLAGNFKIRLAQHKRTHIKSVNTHFNDPSTVIVFTEYMEAEEASKLEKKLIAQHFEDSNWNCLNEKPGGGLGGSHLRWDDELIEKTIKGKTKQWIEDNFEGAWTYVKRSPRREYFKSLVIYARKRSSTFEKDNAYSFEFLLEEVRGKSQTDLSTAVATALYRHPRKKELLAAMKPRQRNKYSLKELIDLCRGKRSKELTSGVRSAMETHPQRDQIHAVMIRPKSKTLKIK